MAPTASKVIEIRSRADQARLRRLSLAAQGLLQARRFGRGLAGTRAAIQHLGYVQIDTISVIERAHHHVVHSRVPGFKPEMIERLLRSGDIFEYWTHAAAFLPMADYRYSLPYKQALKSGRHHWYKNPDRKLMGELLARVRSDGPLRSRDLEADSARSSGWWDWKPAKKALEQLYMEGELMVCSREGFQKSYDLSERVLPTNTNTTTPSTADFARHILEQQLRCHRYVSAKGLSYQRRNPELRSALQALLAERLAQGSLEEIRLANGAVYFAELGAFEAGLPRLPDRMLILSPFDNSLIQRERLRALFDFDYQLECYLPEAKRRFGYFSLPLLFRDAFIGRMDCKAHRKTGRFEIKSLHAHSHGFDDERVTTAFSRAVADFCAFQGCDTVSLTRTQPGKLHQPLIRALATVMPTLVTATASS